MGLFVILFYMLLCTQRESFHMFHTVELKCVHCKV